MSVRVLGADEPYPGPSWEPIIHDGIFPLTAEPGDIYINRHRKPPLIYLFNNKTNCEMTSAKEIDEWVTGGLMRHPTRDHPSNRQSTGNPSSKSGNSSSQDKWVSPPVQ